MLTSVSVHTTEQLKKVEAKELEAFIQELKYIPPENISYSYVFARLSEIIGGTRHDFVLNAVKLGNVPESKLIHYVVNVYLHVCGLNVQRKRRY